MHCLEIVCIRTSAAERDAAIAAVMPFCDEPEVDVRIYRHELHATDLAALMETHSFVSRARWREVQTADEGARR